LNGQVGRHPDVIRRQRDGGSARPLLAMLVEMIGWLSALVLLATLGRQVYTQWRSGSVKGVSRWLFVGQLGASTGFVLYSWLLHNWVFVVTNALILTTAILGECIYLHNRRRHGA
jgi:MtN3 and saliva related transmembrane protein